MRRVGSELALHCEASGQAVERAIDRGDKGYKLARQVVVGEPNCGVPRPNGRCHVRNLTDGLQGATDRILSRSQSDDHKEWYKPRGIDHELAQNRMRQEASFGKTSDEHRKWTDDARDADTHAMIILHFGPKSLQTKVAGFLTWNRPSRNDLAETAR